MICQLKQVRTEYLGKFNGAVGCFNADVIAYPDANWEEIAKNFVTSLGLKYNPLMTESSPTIILPKSSTRSFASTASARLRPRYLVVYFAGLFHGCRRRSRLIDHAAQGEPDRLRERRRQTSESPTRCSTSEQLRCRAFSAI